MNQPTPAEVQRTLLAIGRELQERIDAHPRLAEDAVNTERDSKLAQATAMLALDPKETVQVKQARVDKATIDEQAAAEMAAKLLASNKIAIDGAMSRLSSLTSLNAALREEMRLTRIGDVGA